jgi:hypothetical protein
VEGNKTVAKPLQPRACLIYCLTVAIDTKDPEGRKGLEESFGVTTQPESPIHQQRIIGLERWRQKFDDSVSHYGDVFVGGGHGRPLPAARIRDSLPL